MLSAPMEILELNDGESISFHVENFQIDQGIIRPAHAPGGKAIEILRLHVPQAEKKMFPYYWDVTGQGAIAQLRPILESGAFAGRAFRLTASGFGAKKRYAVEVV